jgi:hypothetical protein
MDMNACFEDDAAEEAAATAGKLPIDEEAGGECIRE